MPHVYGEHEDYVATYEIIGENGEVNAGCTWSSAFGVSWSFPLCDHCHSPPLYYGKHASRCVCCLGAISTCAEFDAVGGGCAGEVFFDDEIDGGCVGGYASYGDAGVGVGGGGSAGVVAVQRLPNNHWPHNRWKLIWEWNMNWTCGLHKDVVRGRCSYPTCEGWEPSDSGVCASSLGESTVNIPLAGVSVISDDYDCPCDCQSPLAGACDAQQLLQYQYYVCPENPVDTPLQDLWGRHFAQCPIKGNPRHAIGNDPFEIGDCYTEVNSLCSVGGHTYMGPLGDCHPEDDGQWWQHSLFHDACEALCAEDCETCEAASQMADFGGVCEMLINGCMYHPAWGNRTSEGGAPGEPGYCTAWTCRKNTGCASNHTSGYSWLEDPMIIPYDVCAIILRVEVMSQSGDCAGLEETDYYYGYNSSPPGCPVECDSPPHLPNPASCGHANAFVGAVSSP